MDSSMLSTIDSDPGTSPELKRKKRRISSTEETSTRFTSGKQQIKKWRTDREQQIYSSKLVEALRRSRRSSREIRETADKVLAVSARGSTRWSRAILTSQRGGGVLMRKHKKAKVIGAGKWRKPAVVKRENRRLPAVQRKVKVLSRLVPGCRKLNFSNLLEEASDYIAALEMQVRAMAALTAAIAGGGSQPPPPASLSGAS